MRPKFFEPSILFWRTERTPNDTQCNTQCNFKNDCHCITNKTDFFPVNEKNQSNFLEILLKLPINYPINKIILNGKEIAVTNFISINTDNYILICKNKEQIISIDSKSIEAIYW
ncbi:hypothetical protein [Bacillus cereus]|uniref:hypothetical protein n=1 Tax=Bacillus cereus TaxID=1396 RepID=UPI00192E0212|nr:hypothetical protein [Bacillus cereus]MDA2331392.1 hypothetical protein [Bacillus cereus]MDA2337265.1 hypothetical protein [Bacillus cereus]